MMGMDIKDYAHHVFTAATVNIEEKDNENMQVL